MELSSIELHVFVSLTVILGSGLIALIVDYLKGSNEQLRERNIELRVRREEEGRRSITEIRLLREQMVAAANGAAPAEQPKDAARILEPATAAATLAPQPEPAPSAQAIIEQAVERAVRNAAAEKAEAEPDKQLASKRDRPRSTWWESATSKPQPRLEVVARKEAAEEKKSGPPKEEKAPDSLLDHVIFATEPNGGAPRVEPSPAEAEVEPEVKPEVERVVLVAGPAADLAAAEPSRVVFVTPLAAPGIPEIRSLTLPEPEPAPVVVEEPPMEPAPAESPAPEIEPAAALAAAPQEVEPEVERVVFAAEPATDLAAAEPSPVVFMTPLVEPGIPEAGSLPLPEHEPAPAEFPAPEIEPAA
ncbi:MAG: hypothetical protein NT090_14590, partial [Acidobacteria bacterium]|nr:hypothetical protein [Acidobacteriota bacterium]